MKQSKHFHMFAPLIGVSMLWAISVSAQETTPEPGVEYVFDWPAPMPTDAQIEAAQACDLEAAPAERYPEKLGVEDLADAYEPDTACDWAALAVAYASRAQNDQPLPDEATQAYIRAVSQNPALAFSLPILSGYFGAAELVSPPPFADQPITQVEIEHSWAGLGSPVGYSIKIAKADSKPIVSGRVDTSGDDYFPATPVTVTPATPTPYVLPTTVEAELVQALAASLTDLLPMTKQFSDTPCWDNYPDWTVTLTFVDGTTVVMVTNASNILFTGGPWQTEIEGQNYMQHSADFLLALIDLRDALNLPVGQTVAYGCGDVGDPLFEAF